MRGWSPSSRRARLPLLVTADDKLDLNEADSRGTHARGLVRAAKILI